MSTEYVNDVPYVRHFISELSPASIRLVAALNGVTPPPAQEFDYCELGCAHADTLVALAASHPKSGFLGIDISDAHITSAKKLARDGALDNVGFLKRDFSDLLQDEDIAELDYIVAHGVLSWVSPEKRKAVIDFASARLKPGGLLYVSYNAMPGWAAIEPLRQLLLSPTSNAKDETSLDRARRGVEFAKLMESSGAEYFKKNPSAKEMLGTITQAGMNYVVHEYLHEHWAPMYFAHVAWEMTQADLHFAGVLPIHLNFRDTAIPEALDPAFAPINERLLFESLKDFAINESFRRDIYVKGKTPRTSEATDAYLDETIWGTTQTDPSERDCVQFTHRTIDLSAPIFVALINALEEGAAPIDELVQRTGFEKSELRAAVKRMVVAQRAIPMQARTKKPDVSPGSRRLRVPSPHNQMLLRRITSDTPIIMTSTAAGAGFKLAALEALAIRCLTEAEPNDRAKWIGDFVDRQTLQLTVGDRVFKDRADQRRIILETVDNLIARDLSKLVELGILE